MNHDLSCTDAREFIRGRKPKLLRAFDDLSQFLELRPETPANPALHITLASEYVLISTATVHRAVENGDFEQFAGIAYSLSQSSPPATAVFVDMYPLLPYPLKHVASAIAKFATINLRAVGNAADLLRICLGSPSSERALVYLQLFTEMAAGSPGTISEFLTSFATLQGTHSPEFLQRWLRRGADLISSGRTEEGVRFLLAQSRESRHDLGITSAILDDIKKVLQIYCTSVANRPVSVAALSISTFGVSEPYTDGRTVFLPAELSHFDTIEDNEMSYSAIAALQAAQIELGSFALSGGSITFRTELQSRYGLVLPDVMEHVNKQYQARAQAIRERSTGETEVVFAGDRLIEVLATPHEEFFYRFPTPDLMRELFSLLETYRIEANLSSRYPGLRDDFRKLNAVLRRTPPPPQRESGDGFVEAIQTLIRMSMGEPAAALTGRRGAVSEVFAENLRLLTSESADVHDTALVAFNIYNALYDTFPIIPWCRRNDVRAIFSPMAKSALQPEIVLDVSPELYADISVESPLPDLEEQEIQDIDLTSFTQTEKKAKQLREAILNGDVRVYRYHEYDADKAKLLKKHCTLYESVLEEGDADFYQKTLKEHDRTFRRLRKRFLMMQPEELELTRRWLLGDEIHIGDAFDFATDLLRGSTPDGKIYQRRKHNRRDIAAAILLDASSSTEEKVDGESIISVEKKALCLLAGVLDPIGDTFGIFSYFSMGRHNNFYMVAKDFHEKWNLQTKGRIEGIGANSSNRDGCAIRHTTARLLERPETTKLLLLLSDGIPADAGYGSDDGANTTDYAIEDTRRAVLEARMAGVVPYCITIDKSAKSYIPHLYGDFHYTVIRSVGELPEKLSRLYLRLTR